ncbi:PspC domain-containing protein [Phycicoccus endophyticus]|uniref:PspC domain-containing protein n=1 Tax=Phycicoccus endophyticus TaxID=1690220 RepID=A0A7G9R2N7_9MICO|nr:PspC domain-containing protein [Phycicoccus endophyticus]QNN49862.1 PspC domain-containing protein [Phycicoccus endophyticus]
MTQSSTTSTPPGGSGPGVLDDGLARLRGSGIRRDADRRWFGGVCAGLAAHYGVDPLLIRAAAIVLTIAGGIGVPVYLLLWLLLPDARGEVIAERALRHGDAWAVVLALVTGVVVLGVLLSFLHDGSAWGAPLWLLVPVGLVGWFLATRSRGTSSPTGTVPPPPPAGSAQSVPPPAPSVRRRRLPPPATPRRRPPARPTPACPTPPRPATARARTRRARTAAPRRAPRSGPSGRRRPRRHAVAARTASSGWSASGSCSPSSAWAWPSPSRSASPGSRSSSGCRWPSVVPRSSC